MVCPYTRSAIEKECIYFSVYESKLSEVKSGVKYFDKLLEIFLQKEPASGSEKVFKSFIILLPNLPVSETENLMENLHKEIKPNFVKKGSMIGQFRPECSSNGIYNQEFRPLRSPVPLMVIRYMVKNDYLFLSDFRNEYFQNFPFHYDPKALDFFNK